MDGAETEAFKSNIGSPQGDSASGPIFTVYFEYALKEIRNTLENLSRRIQHIERTSMPQEMIYADDYDYLTSQESIKKYINKISEPILKKHNLFVNKDKTENTELQRCEEKNAKEKRGLEKSTQSWVTFRRSGRYCEEKTTGKCRNEEVERYMGKEEGSETEKEVKAV